MGGREGGDNEVQTNKHTNPKASSACSAGPEVVRADAPGRSGRRGRAAERGWGGRGRSQGPQARTGERCALALRAKVSEPRGCGVDFFFEFIYIFIPSLSLPSLPVLSHSSPRLLSQTTLATPLHTSFHTPAPQKTWGGKKVPLGFLGLRGGDKG